MGREHDAPQFFGRYQVLEELGSGAMGVVYLCVDARLARPVAVKVVKDADGLPPTEREQYLARFRQEAQAAGRLSHPDLVQVYDVGPSYLVMEFVDGRPLSEVIRAGPALSVGEIGALVLRVSEALDYAHRQGVVHRDVKPANIMRLDDGQGGVKVMDFGVARLPSSTLTAFGTVVGSVRYMAPEQMLGRAVDGRADVFSLGAVAYELLTGRAPYPGKTATEVVTRVVHGEHVPACEVEPRLPRACDETFTRVFAPDPAQRFACCVDFARALQAATRTLHDTCLRDPQADARGASLPARTTAVYAFTEATRVLEQATLAGHAGVSETQVIAPGAALVDVDSLPAGARVRVDGNEVGATPLRSLPVAPGPLRVEFELEGHAPARLEVAVAPGAWHLLSQALERLPVDDLTPFAPDVTPPQRLSGELPSVTGPADGPRTVEVEFVVRADGGVSDLRVVRSAGARLDDALTAAVGSWIYSPARRGGAAVAVRVRVTHSFAAGAHGATPGTT